MTQSRRVLLPIVPLLALSAVAGRLPAQQGQGTQPPPPIEDNSFLIEEAFNQEPGVIQHINTFQRARDGSGWAYSLTDEWPLRSVRHQLSVTIPVLGTGATAGARATRGLGDVALNYRFGMGAGGPEGAPVRLFAPRLSLLAPTGSAEKGFGAGGASLQGNLPASLELTPALITHWNAGATYTPRARAARDGATASTASYALGASAIWLARSTFNVMLESLWTSTEVVATETGVTARERRTVVSPGVRGALNFRSGLQVVPGVAVPLTVGRGRATDAAVFLYLSFEHEVSRDDR